MDPGGSWQDWITVGGYLAFTLVILWQVVLRSRG